MTTRPLETPWLRKEEAAARGRVSLEQIGRGIRDGSLQHRRIGRRVVIHRDWLDAWLEDPPTAEASA